MMMGMDEMVVMRRMMMVMGHLMFQCLDGMSCEDRYHEANLDVMKFLLQTGVRDCEPARMFLG